MSKQQASRIAVDLYGSIVLVVVVERLPLNPVEEAPSLPRPVF